MKKEMPKLSSCEIIEELKNIGLDTPDEIIEFLEEYSRYYTIREIDPDNGRNGSSQD